MKEQKVTPRFALLQYEVMHQLEISIAEYFYLDMVYQLSRDGWCYKSLIHIASDMRITERGVRKLRDRLTDRGLLLKGRHGKVKTSVKWNSVYVSHDQSGTKFRSSGTKFRSNVELSSTKNNSENNSREKEPTKLLEKGFTHDLRDYEAKLRARVGYNKGNG